MKTYKPTTPSRRKMVTIDYRKVLTTDKPTKSLTHGQKRSVGRNSQGRVTTRHKGGGNKRLYRDVDFKYDKRDIPAVVKTVEYDPNRSGFIGILQYKDGEKRYTLLPKNVTVGAEIMVSEKASIKPGNRLPLKFIPVGTFIYNIEIKPQGGAKMVRSAGVFAQLIANDAGYAQIKMPSTEVRKIPELAWASIGSVSNDEYHLINYGKAGRSRWKGIRPTVRGSAMNPVDHPLGGGEGAQGAGMKRVKNVYGKGIRGKKTRGPKKYSNFLIVSRRKTGKKRKGN
ncbi:MAG TPA: 50S ribosomal protein L2 [Candidatus Paceibacterota bacterium]|nr:50S ribosomal protein L2 [Candidatus Paceibacterota bacterium]MBP9852165.1 50S ribosomal protein L2 [Candidatus Paceibacterota bacterium]HRH31053.1 50S ribosomal protein L2 [Candidatus Paceibacterota bacterium]